MMVAFYLFHIILLISLIKVCDAAHSFSIGSSVWFHSRFDLNTTFEICHPTGHLLLSKGFGSTCSVKPEYQNRVFIQDCTATYLIFTLEDLQGNDRGNYTIRSSNQDYNWLETINVQGVYTYIKATPQNAVLGNDVTLSCTFTSIYGDSSIRWIKTKNRIRTVLEGTTEVDLKLSNLSTDDNGDEYQCTYLISGFDYGQSDKFRINAINPVVYIVGRSAQFHVEYDRDATFNICHPKRMQIISKFAGLNCKVDLDFENRVFIEACDTRNLIFTVEDLTKYDIGTYRLCQNNETFDWSKTIDVKGVYMYIQPSPTEPVLGSSLLLNCNFQELGVSMTTVRWVKTKDRIRTLIKGETGRTLMLDNITTDNNGEDYECSYLNTGIMFGNSDKFTLAIYDPPKAKRSDLLTGSSTEFYLSYASNQSFSICHPKGAVMISMNAGSECTVTEEFEDRVFVEACGSQNLIFIIGDLSKYDTGIYKLCIPYPYFDWSETIYVKGVYTSVQLEPQLAMFGSHVTLTCSFQELRPSMTTVRWVKTKKRTRTVLGETGRVWTLSNLTMDNNGEAYECTYLNTGLVFGISDELPIIVYIPPTVVSYTINSNASDSQSVNKSENLTIVCDVKSTFPMNISIEYEGVSHTGRYNNSATLTLDIETTCNMTGQFICTAKTDTGQMSIKTIEVSVENCLPEIGESNIIVHLPLGGSKSLKIPFTGTKPDLIPTRREASSITVSISGQTLVVNITNVARGDYNMESNITLINKLGEDQAILKLSSKGPPEPPQSLNYSDISNEYVVLQWIPGFEGKSNQSFIIEHRNKSHDWMNVTKVPSIGKDSQKYKYHLEVITGLRYDFRVKGYNDDGESQYSNIVSISSVQVAVTPAACSKTTRSVRIGTSFRFNVELSSDTLEICHPTAGVMISKVNGSNCSISARYSNRVVIENCNTNSLIFTLEHLQQTDDGTYKLCDNNITTQNWCETLEFQEADIPDPWVTILITTIIACAFFLTVILIFLTWFRMSRKLRSDQQSIIPGQRTNEALTQMDSSNLNREILLQRVSNDTVPESSEWSDIANSNSPRFSSDLTSDENTNETSMVVNASSNDEGNQFSRREVHFNLPSSTLSGNDTSQHTDGLPHLLMRL